MRKLVVLLILLNAALFAWFYYQQQTAPQVTPVPLLDPSEGQTLILKNEPNNLNATQDKTTGEPQLPTTSAATAQTKQAAEAKQAPKVKQAAAAQQAQTVVMRCYRSTPFTEQIDAKHLAAKIKKLGYQASIESSKGKTNLLTKYWIYVPNQGNKQQMQKIQSQLKKHGFDTFLISKGKLSGGISLGIYRSKKSVESLEKDVNKLSIPVTVDLIDGSRDQYRVIFFTPSLPNNQLLDQLQENNQNIRWRRTQCPL